MQGLGCPAVVCVVRLGVVWAGGRRWLHEVRGDGVARWVVEVAKGKSDWQQRCSSGSTVDSLSDALAAGFETRCVGCSRSWAPRNVFRVSPLIVLQAMQKERAGDAVVQQKSG
jgi:hypothetical protein